MSKVVKQMELDTLRKTFSGVKNLVLLSTSKIDAPSEHNFRMQMRKKNVRLHQVKNTFGRKILGEMGISLENVWSGPTVFAWGPDNVKELSQAIDGLMTELGKKDPKIKEKVLIKCAVAEGQQVTFEEAKKMPTRVEILGQIVGMILGPASEIAAMLTGPASQVAGAIATIAEKKEDAPAA
jgi:large subunit ribosomal protein L10